MTAVNEYYIKEIGQEKMPYNSENRRIKADRTKQKIYKSAEKLFKSHAFHEVSVDEIVKMAGVAKGSFYVHFASKDALYASLFSDYTGRIDIDYKSYLDSLPQDMLASARLLCLIEKIVDVLITTIGYEKLKAVYQFQIAKPINMEVIYGYNRGVYNMVEDVLSYGIQKGEFKEALPLEILTRHFVMAIRGITYEWCIRYPDFDYKAEMLQHFGLLLDGLRSSPLTPQTDQSGR